MPKEPKGPKVREDHTAVVGVAADGTHYSFAGHGQLKRWRKSDLTVVPKADVPAGTVVTPIPESYEFPPPVKKPKDA